MTQAKIGDTVQVHYTGKLVDGSEFDTSVNRNPLQFKIGNGQIIPGFEEAVVGMRPGESKKTNIKADEAYGPRHEELVLVVDRSQFPSHISPQVNQALELRQADGRVIEVRVTEVSDSSVTLDANHPLAGQELTFDIELVAIL